MSNEKQNLKTFGENINGKFDILDKNFRKHEITYFYIFWKPDSKFTQNSDQVT